MQKIEIKLVENVLKESELIICLIVYPRAVTKYQGEKKK